MFIVEPIKQQKARGELKLLYKKTQKSLGFVPPHFELFATIDAKSLMEFIEYNLHFKNHPNIDESLLPYLRLCIAQKEGRAYCINFNTKILEETAVDKDILIDIYANIEKLPFNEKQRSLFSKVIYAIYNADAFTHNDLQELYDVGFSDRDFYELLNYGTNFMAKSKMIEVYLDSKGV